MFGLDVGFCAENTQVMGLRSLHSSPWTRTFKAEMRSGNANDCVVALAAICVFRFMSNFIEQMIERHAGI